MGLLPLNWASLRQRFTLVDTGLLLARHTSARLLLVTFEIGRAVMVVKRPAFPRSLLM